MKSFARKPETVKAVSPHRLRLLGVVFAFTLLVSKADAQTGWFSASISQLYVDSTGSINVFFSANSACGSSRLTYVHSVIGNDDAKAMLAALLSWQAQSMQVSVYVTECVAGTSSYGKFDAAYSGQSG